MGICFSVGVKRRDHMIKTAKDRTKARIVLFSKTDDPIVSKVSLLKAVSRGT